MAIENYLAERKLNTGEALVYPTAPDEDEASSSTGRPTAPSEELVAHNTTECVVCMDAQVITNFNLKIKHYSFLNYN